MCILDEHGRRYVQQLVLDQWTYLRPCSSKMHMYYAQAVVSAAADYQQRADLVAGGDQPLETRAAQPYVRLKPGSAAVRWGWTAGCLYPAQAPAALLAAAQRHPESRMT